MPLVVLIAVAGLLGLGTVAPTTSAFSVASGNSGNNFSAAASFVTCPTRATRPG
jgi:hypothetical protein